MRGAVIISILIALSVAGMSVVSASSVDDYTETARADGDTVEVKKERVRKEITHGDPEGTDDEEDYEETDYGWTDYEETGAVEPEEFNFYEKWIFDCLSGIFGGVVGSFCEVIGYKVDDKQVDMVTNETDIIMQDADIVYVTEDDIDFEGIPYLAGIEPIDTTQETVDFWDKPGGYGADGFVLEVLPKGTEVEVTEFYFYEETLWVRVTRTEPNAMVGWVREMDIVPFERDWIKEDRALEAPTSVVEDFEQGETVMPSTYRAEIPKLDVLAEVSYPVFPQGDISEEYQEGASRLGAEVGFFTVKKLRINFPFGYMQAKGEPMYDYVAPGLKDIPKDSDLKIMSFGMQLGQFLSPAGAIGFLSYGIGPMVFNVEEKALILTFENDIYTGRRTEELSEWKVGGEVKVAFGLLIKGKIPLSFSTRFSVIPWDSKEEKSLTLDYLSSSSISMFSFGLSVGYLFR